MGETTRVVCFSCNSILRAPAGKTGRAKCPKCGAKVEIEEEPIAPEAEPAPEPVATARRPERQLKLNKAQMAALIAAPVLLMVFLAGTLVLARSTFRAKTEPTVVAVVAPVAPKASPPSPRAKATPMPKASAKAEPPPKAIWKGASGEAVTINDRVVINGLAANMREVNVMVIILCADAKEKTKRLSGTSWRGSVTVKDEHGNIYREINNADTARIRAMCDPYHPKLQQSPSQYPTYQGSPRDIRAQAQMAFSQADLMQYRLNEFMFSIGALNNTKPFVEALCFEKPIEEAKNIILTIPLANVGEEGVLVYECHRDKWK